MVESLRLCLNGAVLHDDQALRDCMTARDVLVLVGRRPPGVATCTGCDSLQDFERWRGGAGTVEGQERFRGSWTSARERKSDLAFLWFAVFFFPSQFVFVFFFCAVLFCAFC